MIGGREKVKEVEIYEAVKRRIVELKMIFKVNIHSKIKFSLLKPFHD